MPREVKDNGTGMQKDLPTFVKKKMEESWQ